MEILFCLRASLADPVKIDQNCKILVFFCDFGRKNMDEIHLSKLVVPQKNSSIPQINPFVLQISSARFHFPHRLKIVGGGETLAVTIRAGAAS
jgi:hypothetical protein